MRDLIDELRAFAKEGEREKFHSQKNLASAFSVDVAALVEIFL